LATKTDKTARKTLPMIHDQLFNTLFEAMFEALWLGISIKLMKLLILQQVCSAFGQPGRCIGSAANLFLSDGRPGRFQPQWLTNADPRALRSNHLGVIFPVIPLFGF
jgi:hypothetical protein